MTLLTLRIDLTATGSRWFGTCCCGYNSAPRKTFAGITILMDRHIASEAHRRRREAQTKD